MKITVIGTGEMGSAIATAIVQRTKHEVFLKGSRPKSASVVKLCKELEVKEANEYDLLTSEIAILAVPGEAIEEAAKELGKFKNALLSVVSSSDYLKSDDASPVSAAEKFAELVPTAHVVHGFTSVAAQIMREPSKTKSSVFVCGDNKAAVARISELATDLGFDPVKAGGLANARYAEAAGHLWAALAFDGGYGVRVHFEVHKK